MKHTNIQKSLIKSVIEAESQSGYKLLLENNDNWNYELPENLKSQPTIVLDIVGWSLENSYLVDDGLFITVAFGENEYERLVDLDEILSIATMDGKLIYQKIMRFERNQKPKMELSRKIKIPKEVEETDAMVYSMETLKKLNNHK